MAWSTPPTCSSAIRGEALASLGTVRGGGGRRPRGRAQRRGVRSRPGRADRLADLGPPDAVGDRPCPRRRRSAPGARSRPPAGADGGRRRARGSLDRDFRTGSSRWPPPVAWRRACPSPGPWCGRPGCGNGAWSAACPLVAMANDEELDPRTRILAGAAAFGTFGERGRRERGACGTPGARSPGARPNRAE